MHDSHGLSGPLQTGIGLFYFLVSLMNLGFAAYQHYERKNKLQSLIWAVVAAVFLVHAGAYLVHQGWPIFPWLQHGVDYVMNPVSYFVLAAVGFSSCLLYFRRIATEPVVAWSILMFTLWFSGLAMTNNNFKDIITKPDNVPIVMLIFSVGFFTWLALRKAVINDDRIARGEPPLEKVDDEQGAGLARPGLHRADRDGHLHAHPDRLGDRAQGPARTAGVVGADPEPVEGARGTSSACRKCSSTSIRGWPASCCRR